MLSGVVLVVSLSWCVLLKELCLSEDLGFCSLFYLGHIHIALWDSLSGLVHFGIVCLASQAPDWAVAFWDGLWPVMGYPLLGVYPSMSIVRLIMIGYHCNCLDGWLDYQASAHWLIGGTTMYQLCDQ